FSPQVVEQAAGWIPTILGLIGFVILSGLACVTYFRRVVKLDMTTSYFAGMPGGLVEMVIVGEEKGGDARTIALVHSARILLVVMSLPFLMELVTGVSLGGTRQQGPSFADTSWISGLWLVATALIGSLVGGA